MDLVLSQPNLYIEIKTSLCEIIIYYTEQIITLTYNKDHVKHIQAQR